MPGDRPPLTYGEVQRRLDASQDREQTLRDLGLPSEVSEVKRDDYPHWAHEGESFFVAPDEQVLARPVGDDCWEPMRARGLCRLVGGKHDDLALVLSDAGASRWWAAVRADGERWAPVPNRVTFVPSFPVAVRVWPLEREPRRRPGRQDTIDGPPGVLPGDMAPVAEDAAARWELRPTRGNGRLRAAIPWERTTDAGS